MTALLLAAVPIVFFSFFNDLDFGDIKENLKINNVQSNLEIAADSSFANKTLKFNSGQTIYVRVTVDNDGKDKHVLNLRDNNYNLITTYSMAKSGNQFSVNFPAPNESGIYSLEANIVSTGSVTNFVKTIEVGPSTSSGQVSVKIENQVNTDNQVLSESDRATVTSLSDAADKPGSSSYSEPGSEESGRGFFGQIWLKIVKFFQGIFGT